MAHRPVTRAELASLAPRLGREAHACTVAGQPDLAALWHHCRADVANLLALLDATHPRHAYCVPTPTDQES